MRQIDADDREKLIALLRSNVNVLQAAGASATATLRLADHLIANGVTVQKHGRWIEKEDIVESYLEDCTEVFWECSVCRAPNWGEANYCPNCGAKMDLKEEPK